MKGTDEKLPRGFGRSLVVQYVTLMTAVAAVLVALYCAWSYSEQNKQMESQLLAEARVLEQSVQATWDFIDYEQDNINYDADGTYNFKGLYCSLVGKSVGKLFTLSTDSRYVLRYTRLDPRNALDEPDAFERAALESFYETGMSEYYGFAENAEGSEEFRYVGAIYLKDSCLSCHGQPAGELDVTGFAKEGLSAGDNGGAVSIVIPAGQYQRSIDVNVVLLVAFFVLFLTVTFASSLLFFRRKVTRPLDDLEQAVKQMGQGNLKVAVGQRPSVREIDQLASGVKSMAVELDALYETLEEKVDLRTQQYSQANAQLEQQRRALARANELLEQTNAKLADENEYRTNIVAILSHELRTPLTSILAFVDLWETSGETHSRESRECLEKIKAQSQVLLEMVNNALDMVRVESDVLVLSRDIIDAVDLASTIAGSIQPIAQQKGVDLQFSVGADVPLVIGDWAQMEKILVNLLSNAVKFTDEGGHVRLDVAFDGEGATAGGGVAEEGSAASEVGGCAVEEAQARAAAGSEGGCCDAAEEPARQLAETRGVTPSCGWLRFSVTDDGIGIEEDRLESIFDRFVQADASVSRKYRGSGLGLSLVKKTAEALGGAVSVESELGRGSRFTVVLPVEVLDLDDEGDAAPLREMPREDEGEHGEDSHR